MDEICSVPPPLHTLKIWGAGSTPREATGPSLSVFLFFFVCPSRYDARHRKPRRCVYALNLGGTGISPPDKSPPGQKTPRTKAPPNKNPPGQKTPREKVPSGDIFYCSGSRQLNHSSYYIKSCVLYQIVSFSMTLSDLEPEFQGHSIV